MTQTSFYIDYYLQCIYLASFIYFHILCFFFCCNLSFVFLLVTKACLYQVKNFAYFDTLHYKIGINIFKKQQFALKHSAKTRRMLTPNYVSKYRQVKWSKLIYQTIYFLTIQNKNADFLTQFFEEKNFPYSHFFFFDKVLMIWGTIVSFFYVGNLTNGCLQTLRKTSFNLRMFVPLKIKKF